jgi:hypothetical protein
VNAGTIAQCATDSWATVESTDPNPPKGGNWALSSLVTLSANQTSNLSVGQPIRFDTISGDHTLQNYRVKIKGGQKAELIGAVRPIFTNATDYAGFQWYNVTGSSLVGVDAITIPTTYTNNYTGQGAAVASVSPLVDTEYELRVISLNGTITQVTTQSYAQVHSTLPNASVTSQVIKKETVAANTTAWTVTMPVACKSIRVKLVLINPTGSLNNVTIGVNGNSTGHYQQVYSTDGTTLGANEGTTPSISSVPANSYVSYLQDYTVVTGVETAIVTQAIIKTTDTNLSTSNMSSRIAQSADISSITFTGSQASGIGAGSYIIVERVDADLSQDLGWQDYTPTCYIDLTSATTVPNITPSVRYRVQGKTLFMQGTLNFTGAPTGSTDLAISLPTGVNVVSMTAASKFTTAGHCNFFDSSVGTTGVWFGTVRLPLSTENTGRVSFRAQTAISTVIGVAPTAPFTWATGDQLEFDFFTEIQ